MNRTTELLKEIEKLEADEKLLTRHQMEKKIKNIKDNDLSWNFQYGRYKSELRGRLDVLKDEVEFIKNIFDAVSFTDHSYIISNRLQSIQQEIKLIEEKI